MTTHSMYMPIIIKYSLSNNDKQIVYINNEDSDYEDSDCEDNDIRNIKLFNNYKSALYKIISYAINNALIVTPRITHISNVLASNKKDIIRYLQTNTNAFYIDLEYEIDVFTCELVDKICSHNGDWQQIPLLKEQTKKNNWSFDVNLVSF